MGELTERIGIPFEIYEIRPLLVGKMTAQRLPVAFAEPCGDSFFPRMPERRVSKIVTKASRRDYVGHLLKCATGFLTLMAASETKPSLPRHRPSHRRNFKTVGQSIMHEYTTRQRKHLSLVLKAAERR